jgi:hypothetical protein
MDVDGRFASDGVVCSSIEIFPCPLIGTLLFSNPYLSPFLAFFESTVFHLSNFNQHASPSHQLQGVRS